MKMLDEERRKKKGEEKMQIDPECVHVPVRHQNDLEIKTDDLVV